MPRDVREHQHAFVAVTDDDRDTLNLVLLVRQREDGDRARARKLMVWLVIATAMGLGVAAFLQFGTGMERPYMIWPYFFLLWFGIAMPLCDAKNPAWFRPNPAGIPARSASLVSRAGAE